MSEARRIIRGCPTACYGPNPERFLDAMERGVAMHGGKPIRKPRRAPAPVPEPKAEIPPPAHPAPPPAPEPPVAAVTAPSEREAAPEPVLARVEPIPTMAELRREYNLRREVLLQRALAAADGNQTQAAAILDMDRGAFIRDFKVYVGCRPADFTPAAIVYPGGQLGRGPTWHLHAHIGAAHDRGGAG